MPDEQPRRRWGKAGERLDPTERDRRFREIRARANRTAASRRQSKRDAYRRWRGGFVVPARITQALDLRSLHGPEVDTACKAVEPEVDQWEAGERYPTWAQLLALADLTDFPPDYFTTAGDPPIPAWETSLWFHITEAERHRYRRDYKPPVMAFSRAALDARPPSRPDVPDDPDDALLAPPTPVHLSGGPRQPSLFDP